VLNKRQQLKQRLRRWLYPPVLLLVSFTLSIPSALADCLIVLSRASDSYQQTATALAAHLKTPYKITTIDALTAENFNTNGYQQIVAVGSHAGDLLFDNIPQHKNLFISFLPRQTYEALLQKYEGHTRIRAGKVTAVFLDQPYNRQLALARLIAPEAKVIATALGPNSQKDLALLNEAATAQGFTLNHTTLKETDNPIHKLQPLIREADIFLALPDKSVFTRTTAKWILYISFRQRIPLLGFSKKYVEAGALAAVHSTPEDIGQQTAELVNRFLHNQTLPAASYPTYFSVTTNDTAANSLRLDIPSPQRLTQELMELER